MYGSDPHRHRPGTGPPRDIILADIAGTGVDLVATKTVGRR